MSVSFLFSAPMFKVVTAAFHKFLKDDGTFLVEDGEIVGATKSMRFTQSYIDALNGVTAIGDRLRVLRENGCTIAVPAIQLNHFRFTSATK